VHTLAAALGWKHNPFSNDFNVQVKHFAMRSIIIMKPIDLRKKAQNVGTKIELPPHMWMWRDLWKD
jgi:hypothetical protein